MEFVDFSYYVKPTFYVKGDLLRNIANALAAISRYGRGLATTAGGHPPVMQVFYNAMFTALAGNFCFLG